MKRSKKGKRRVRSANSASASAAADVNVTSSSQIHNVVVPVRNSPRFRYTNFASPNQFALSVAVPVAALALNYTPAVGLRSVWDKFHLKEIKFRLHFYLSTAATGYNTPLAVAYDPGNAAPAPASGLAVMQMPNSRLVNLSPVNPTFELVIRNPTNVVNGNVANQQILSRDAIGSENIWTAGTFYVGEFFATGNLSVGYSVEYTSEFMMPLSQY